MGLDFHWRCAGVHHNDGMGSVGKARGTVLIRSGNARCAAEQT